METLLQLITQFGLPTALLLLLGWHHSRVVAKKDATIAAQAMGTREVLLALAADKDEEIRRVNEARLQEARTAHDRMLSVATEFTKLAGDTRNTLTLLAERMRG